MKELKKDKKKKNSKEKNSAKKDSKRKSKKEKDSDKKSITLPEWTKYLSTHPEGKNRVEVLKKMSENPAQKPKPLLPGFDWKSMYRETKESGFIF
jgi:hypothetical protein